MTPSPCCCISLRTGGFLIGILEIVSWSINLTFSGIGLVFTAVVDHRSSKSNNRSAIDFGSKDIILEKDNVTYYEWVSSTTDNPEPAELVHQFVTVAYIVTSLCLTLSIVRIIIAAVLLMGIQKSNLGMIKCWFAVKILVLCLTICLYGTSLATEQFHAGNLIYYGISIGFSFYFLWVIFALMVEMKKQKILARNPKHKF